MQIRVFQLSLSNPEPVQSELNSFLRSHRILEVKSHFVENGGQSFWAFLVQYMEGNPVHQPGKSKTDYKEVLTEEEFKIFSRLREIRKTLAAEDGVPAYMIFTDEELAEIVKQKCTVATDLLKIKGIGDKKVDKYGERFYSHLRQT